MPPTNTELAQRLEVKAQGLTDLAHSIEHKCPVCQVYHNEAAELRLIATRLREAQVVANELRQYNGHSYYRCQQWAARLTGT